MGPRLDTYGAVFLGMARPQPVGNGSNDSARFHENLNLQQQWSTVFENDGKIQIVSVTGWNEWTATKSYGPQHFPDQPYYTVDQFNAEYSRDIEPDAHRRHEG